MALGARGVATALVFGVALTTTRAVRAEEEPGARPPPSASVSWATTQAAEQTRIGRARAARGEPESALRSYLDAVGFDATYGPAYLALAELYEARGDGIEAERAFSMGIEHVVGFFDALWGRARIRARLHRGAEAIEDFEAAASLRPEVQGVLRDLSSAYVAARAFPAALAVARRRLAQAQSALDATATAEARIEVRALQGWVGDLDPVLAGVRGRGPVRHALWAADRKR